jgi:hypothetical protein
VPAHPKNDFAIHAFDPSKKIYLPHFFIEPLADFDIIRNEMNSTTHSIKDRKPAPDLNA